MRKNRSALDEVTVARMSIDRELPAVFQPVQQIVRLLDIDRLEEVSSLQNHLGARS